MKRIILYNLLIAVLVGACSTEVKNTNVGSPASTLNSTANTSSVNQTEQFNSETTPDKRNLTKEEASIKLSQLLENNLDKFKNIAKYAFNRKELLYVYNGSNNFEFLDNRDNSPVEIEDSLVKYQIISLLKESDIVSVTKNEGSIEFLSSYGWAGIHDGMTYYGEEYGIVYFKDGKEPIDVTNYKKIIDN